MYLGRGGEKAASVDSQREILLRQNLGFGDVFSYERNYPPPQAGRTQGSVQ